MSSETSETTATTLKPVFAWTSDPRSSTDDVEVQSTVPPPPYSQAISQNETPSPSPTEPKPLPTPKPPMDFDDFSEEWGGIFLALYIMILLTYTFGMACLLTGLTHSRAILSGFIVILCLPGLFGVAIKTITERSLSPEDKERKARIKELKELVGKMEKLNGAMERECNKAGGESSDSVRREHDLVSKLNQYPNDEEWGALVNEYEAQKQALKAWVARQMKEAWPGVENGGSVGPAAAAAAAP